MDWRPIGETPPDKTLILYNPDLEDDEDFPCHPYTVSNPAYVACGNAAAAGWTMWAAFDGPNA